MRAWLDLPSNKRRQMNYRFALNWLNKIDPPLEIGGNGHKLTTYADMQRMLKQEIPKK